MRIKGEITVFVSLMLAVLLFFFQICLMSARYAFLRSQTEEALELAECSVLSEYHRELLNQYGLFYLDLGYGLGEENQEYLKQRIQHFLNENLGSGRTEAVETWDFSRASDGNGLAYYEQAVSLMKQKTGAGILEQFREYEHLGQEAEERQADYEAADAREQENFEELKRRREEEEQESTPDPVSDTNALKGGSILHLILEDPEELSGKKVDLSSALSVRNRLAGIGPRGIHAGNVGNDVFFHAYLLERFSHAAELLQGEKEPSAWLDYQIEYTIAGKDSDIANLEAVCGRLLAIREGVNYAYLLTDTAKVAECEALAAALVGVTMIPGLVEALKQILLLSWAFAESVVDLRMLLSGKRVIFWKSADAWKVSLEEALHLENLGFDEGEDPQGLLYQDYLGILLVITSREKKALRSLDIIEGVVRKTPGNQGFYIDQCVDGFQTRMVITNGREWTCERWLCYEW